MISLETACEQMYETYRRCGYPGIGGIGDVGGEWVFVQAPEKENGDLPLGDHPIFIDKETGKTRRMVFDVPDLQLLNSARKVRVPGRFRPVY